ncbi:hypothetical protein RSAG8_06535, partial [Rhizoctonia solani AG-8 WAC10335]
MNNHRPPRAVCRYFSTPRGCRAGSTCLYAHNTAPGPSPRQEKQTCYYYNKGYCRRGASCWYLHAEPASGSKEASSKPKESEDHVCSICFDVPTEFGLLAGCSHIFCLKCIMDWRSSKNKATRLQIRLASGGAPLTTTLTSDSTLHEVALFVESQNPAISSQNVTFSTTFPRKVFSRADFTRTLKELDLVPSAVLMASTS